MADERRNAEHYMDMTAYYGIKNAERELGMNPKAGEIWIVEKDGIEKTVVVVAAHDTYCTVLQLDDRQENPYDIKITARSVMYTDPGMLAYRYANHFAEMIKQMPDGEFADLLGAVADALCIKTDDQSDELEAMRADIDVLEKQIDEHDRRVIEECRRADKLKAENDHLRAQIGTGDMAALRAERDVYKALYEQTIEKLIGERKGA